MGFCVNCGKELPPEAGFCPKCGTKVEIPCCPACGKEVDCDDDFCLSCGAQLHEAEPEPSQPDTATEPETQSEQVTVNEAKDEVAFTLEPVPEKKVETPDICPRCGKETVRGYDHCVYCGTYWEQAVSTADKPVEKIAAKTAEAPEQKTATASEQRFFRDFSWSYKRATSRWTRQRAEIKVEVNDQRLHCTDTRNLRRPAVIEEEIQLKDISKITLAARASFWCWVGIALALTVMVAVPFLPSMGVPLVVSEGEMVLILALVGVFFAIEIWWVRFNTYHHRLVISGAGDSGQKEIVLEALKPDVLRELQTELTQRTGIQLQEPEGGSTASTKAAFGAIIGVLLAIAIFVLVANQSPNTTLASSTNTGNSSLTSQDSTFKSSVITSIDTMERKLIGTWEATDYEVDGEHYYTDSDNTLYVNFRQEKTCIIGSTTSGVLDYGICTWYLPVLNVVAIVDDGGGALYLDIEPDGSCLYMSGESDGVSYTYTYTKTQSDLLLQISSDPSPSVDADELLGYWEDTVYTMPSTAFMSISKESNGNISVCYGYPNGAQYEGLLQLDSWGYCADMVSVWGESGVIDHTIWLDYDGYGISVSVIDIDDDYQQDPYYFVRS